MSLQIAPVPAHPEGEAVNDLQAIAGEVMRASLAVDTMGRRFQVEWDPLAPVTPLGQVVFFSQFLASSGLCSKWVAACPLRYTRPQAPSVGDVLGTAVLAILSGACRCAQVTALRGDRVNPQGLGMEKVVREDSVRRAFQDKAAGALARWQTQALLETCAPALEPPWIAAPDVTVKPLCGHQEGAEVGCNPHQPGRPSHACHPVFLRTRRVAPEVEVPSGREHAAVQGLDNLWRLWDRLAPAQRAWLVCGDCGCGSERIMSQCEARQQNHLFRQRSPQGVAPLSHRLERQGGWQTVRDQWAGGAGELQLTGGTRKRRAVVFRRPMERATAAGDLPLLEQGGVPVQTGPLCESVVRVTNLKENLLTRRQLCRQRADVANAGDELKNQWGWGGFTPQDRLRCQVAARIVAQAYNWWNLFVRCADPARARAAITRRPLRLGSVGRLIKSGGQTTLRLTSNHAQAAQAQSLLTQLSLLISGLNNTAEPLPSTERWRRIWRRILTPCRRPAAALLVESG